MNSGRTTPRLPLRATLVLLAAGLLAGVLPAQLDGAYTVDPAGQGERNFKGLQSALLRLAKDGVKGPVTFVFAPGTYQGSWTLAPIEGASGKNQVTFRAAAKGKVKLVGKKMPQKMPAKKPAEEPEKKPAKAGAKAADAKKTRVRRVPGRRAIPPAEATTIVMGEHVEHVILDGFDFPSTESGPAIFGRPNTEDIEIRNCTFGKEIKGHRNREGVIYVDGNNTATGWRIHHNEFDFPKISSGLYFSQIQKFRIHDNVLRMNDNNTGMYFINNNRAKNWIARNLITGTTGSGNGCAINVALSNLDNDIVDNTIILDTDGHAIRTFGTKTNLNRIHGNLIVITGRGAGIYVNAGGLNHFKSDDNLFFIESKNIGTWNNASSGSLGSWREATSAGPQGMADEHSAAGDPELIPTVKKLILERDATAAKQLEQVMALLGQRDEAARRLAARVCVRLGPVCKPAVPKLAMMCHHRSSGVRGDAAAALGAIGKGAVIAIPEVLMLLDDGNPRVVINAVIALGRMGFLAAKALPRLEKFARNGDSDELRRASREALRLIR